MGRGLNGNRMTLYSPMLALDLPPHTVDLCSYNYMLRLRLVLAIQGSIYAPGDTDSICLALQSIYLLIGRPLAAVSSRLNWTLLCDACLLAWPIVADID